ncbi:LOW QUALITY PROTEIN: putative uncharacterized protein C9orf92 homolog [Otolemur garnettii]|uniref:LOW QUALITY PROTEIN: putative uncharacterized protein C9orf92 homolog n=1 Tax=Otolemur garnettii TaxID=30611 RepID=UPI0006440A9A|nr:LOW QUALITY PROTEIN: putative uncharacterized protein C9orf92 homolog [Otolemur garnettii]
MWISEYLTDLSLAGEEIADFQRTKEREEDRHGLDIYCVADTVMALGVMFGGSAVAVCVGKRMQPSQPPTGKGGKCCTVHGLTRRIHNVQPNLQSPILSAACVD